MGSVFNDIIVISILIGFILMVVAHFTQQSVKELLQWIISKIKGNGEE